MKENYLAKWLNNELSEAELEDLKKDPGYASYEKILRFTEQAEAPDFDVEAQLEQLRNRLSENNAPKVVRLKPFGTLLKVAAAVAVLLAAFYVFTNPSEITVNTELAENREFFLPDQSEVLLNADTHLAFNESKWDSERNVSLEGEAFFKVAKGKTFTVQTEAGSVQVLGTQFNVLQREGVFMVSCFEGLVRVTVNGQQHKLAAGNSFRLVNGQTALREFSNKTIPSWMLDESSFDSMPLSYVLDELERQFDLEVRTENIDLTQLFTGTFSNTNKNLALKSISTPFQINYELKGNKVLIYAKKE